MLATARSGTVDVCPKAIPTTNKQGVRAFIDRGEGGNRGEGLQAETAQSAQTAILELVISGLISIILL